jgi:putative membrane protein
MISHLHLPTVNAILNGTSAVLLACGFFFIMRKNIFAHRICMTSAIAVSALFLFSYVTYHLEHGSTKFLGTGRTRPD